MMRGGHLIKAYSKTQANIALSSAEAELYGVVKASSESLGISAAYSDWGEEVQGRVWADASAALGIVGRKGLGRIRHLDTSMLWVQEASLRRRLLYEKVQGEYNVADLMTKHVSSEVVHRHTSALGM